MSGAQSRASLQNTSKRGLSVSLSLTAAPWVDGIGNNLSHARYLIRISFHFTGVWAPWPGRIVLKRKVLINAFECQFPSVCGDIWSYTDSKDVTSADKDWITPSYCAGVHFNAINLSSMKEGAVSSSILERRSSERLECA